MRNTHSKHNDAHTPSRTHTVREGEREGEERERKEERERERKSETVRVCEREGVRVMLCDVILFDVM